ncbi:hypothetical protein [Rhizobacter sp. Root404]|uniref:hypothetical protein n=1 Tax=Rhizobacter sp. Root404 TaxID=1736528 RepID=UPI0012FA60E3|nr:hypothetical protein [Rhizobacter sp. Root404]
MDTTLAVARIRAHRADKTHFTVFPELSIPGIEGVARIRAAMQQDDWPVGTIVIGGVEGLTRNQYAELLAQPNTNHDAEVNGPKTVPVGQWINSSMTWVKAEDGEVHCWVQPKLVPAWVELNRNYEAMYRGRSIYVFKGIFAGTQLPFRFATLLCFDWIGTTEALRVWAWLLQGINDAAAAVHATLPLTWLFVAQCNPQPSHPSFMGEVPNFYDGTNFLNVSRDDTCLVMANVAGAKAPGKALEYGCSAVINTSKFSKPTCMPTYNNGGGNYRGGHTLDNFRDAVFRERGACVHSLLVVNPRSLVTGNAGKDIAVREATVHPFGPSVDPRAPAAAVQAVVKWMNDDLDEPSKSLAVRHAMASLAGVCATAHSQVVSSLRPMPAPDLTDLVLASAAGMKTSSPDTWTDKESTAVEHVLHTFSIFGTAQYPCEFHGQGSQATVTKGDRTFEAIAVRGETHEACADHVKERAAQRRGMLVVVSRDADNLAWHTRLGSILDAGKPLSEDYKFTDPSSAVIQVGYRTFIDAYLGAAERAELEEAIHDAIG